MVRSLFIPLFVFLLPALAAAQQITVRSGAHDGYSRLVLQLPEGARWTTEKRDGELEVAIPGHADGFDTSTVFARIDRRYIEAVEPASGSVTVRYGCDCAAKVFREAGNLLVIDVAPDADPAPPSAISPRVTAFVGTQPLQLPGANPIVPEEPKRVELRPLPALADLAQNSQEATEPEPILPPVPEPPLPTELSEADIDRLTQLQDSLAQQIGVAATRGLLDPVVPRIDLPLTDERPQIDTRIFDSSTPTPDTPNQAGRPIGSNMRITSSADLPENPAIGDITSPTSGVSCPSAGTFDVPNWGAENGLSDGVADLRTGLFTEFDKLDPATAVDLARLYLHFGFGAEALTVLNIDPGVAAAHPELADMAQIMEFGHARGSQYLLPFTDCDTPAALWAVLAPEAVSPSQVVNTDASLRALNALPLHLRRFIAPAVSSRLLAFGRADAAELALRSLERTAEPSTSAAELARADLIMDEGDVAAAQEALADIVASNETQSATALIKFVDSHLKDGTRIAEDVATLVESYAMEMRDDPLGPDLRRTHVLALAKSGQFDAAFAALERAKDASPDSTFATLDATLMTIVTEEADDVAFLERAFAVAADGLSDAPEVTVAVAQRLQSLGFAAEAETLLRTEEDLPRGDDVKLLRSRIALDLSRPLEAEAQLFGVDGPDADRLRAQAREMAGDFAEAVELFETLGEDERSRSAAWLAEDWSGIAETDAPTLSEAARLALSDVQTSNARDGMLARADDALLESGNARQVIEELLATTQPTAPASQ